MRSTSKKRESRRLSKTETPESVKTSYQWLAMLKRRPFFTLFFLCLLSLPSLLGLALWIHVQNFITEAKWIVAGFTPCQYGVSRLLTIAAITLGAICFLRRRISRWLRIVIVAYNVAILSILTLGSLSRSECPKDSRMILLAALEESEDGSAVLMDYQTRGAMHSSHILIPVYYDKTHSPRFWMRGASYDEDIGRIEHALAKLEESGFMTRDENANANIPIEATDDYHSFISPQRWILTDKGRRFHSRFYWLRRAPCIKFYFEPERFAPIEGHDKETSDLNKINFIVTPNE